jgi:hypothetical protein
MLTDLQRRKFTSLFYCIDSNKDGHWEASDFERIADRLANKFLDAAPLGAYQALASFWHGQWRALYGAVHATAPEQISLGDWLLLNERTVLQPYRTVRLAVRQFRALRLLLEPRSAGQNCTARQIAIWFCALNYDLRFVPLALRTLDTDGDGQFQPAELLQRGLEWLGSDPMAPGNWLFGPFDAL